MEIDLFKIPWKKCKAQMGAEHFIFSCPDEIHEQGDDCSMEQCHAKRIQSVTAASVCLHSSAIQNHSNLSLS
jgi:hypothetical protein